MQPTIGTAYHFRDVNGIEGAGECLGLAEYQPNRNDLVWEFDIKFPHDGDEGRGAVLRAPESRIFAGID